MTWESIFGLNSDSKLKPHGCTCNLVSIDVFIPWFSQMKQSLQWGK